MNRRELFLSPDERSELQDVVNSDPKPYRRERAAALLQIAAGAIPAHVAAGGLLRPRDPDTVYGWMDRYLDDGVAGLSIAPGRGRKPAFFSPALQRALHRSGQPAGIGPA